MNMHFIIRGNKSHIHIRIRIIRISLGEVLFRADAFHHSVNSFDCELVSASTKLAIMDICTPSSHALKSHAFNSHVSRSRGRTFHYWKILHNCMSPDVILFHFPNKQLLRNLNVVQHLEIPLYAYSIRIIAESNDLARL